MVGANGNAGADEAACAKKGLVRLNLVMTYPVKWPESTIIRNYVQNFYDALGAERFRQGFRYSCDRQAGTITMAADRGFAMEWLRYMGASTKRGKDRKCAGGFGEGFKVAALTSLRDYHLAIEMESRKWTLRVTTAPGEIDGRTVEFLAYETGERPFRNDACLRIGNATEKFYQAMDGAMQDFYFEGNTLFGKCIAKEEGYAIYEAVKNPAEHRIFGQVFASYERRGSIYIPLVICNHAYHPQEDDRDRDRFRPAQMVDCICEVVRQLDAETAMAVLEYFCPVWNGKDVSGGYHSLDWKPVLDILVQRASGNSDVRQAFQSRYLDSRIVRDTPRLEPDANRRMLAFAWFRQFSGRDRYRFVLPIFHELGIKTVCGLCEEMDGFTTDRTPDPFERRLIEILKESAQEILGDLLVLPRWPQCRILLNPKAPQAGCTGIRKLRGKGRPVNPYGMRVAAEADYVYIQADILRNGSFGCAFSVYSHELLHQYGGDMTASFHQAIYMMNLKILENTAALTGYRARWDAAVKGK